MPRKLKRLVVATLPKPPAMQGHGHDEIKHAHVQKTPAMLGKQPPQGLRKQQPALVLEQVNGLSQGAAINACGPGSIKARRQRHTVSAQVIRPCP